jgi:uncharacterized membrane-anchored protein YhcB (DUF1043 family)
MSAVADVPSWLYPSIIAAAVVFLGMFLTRFGKTSDKTITGSIRIEGLKEELDNAKKNMEKGFDKMENIIDSNNKEMRIEMSKIGEKLEQMSGKVNINDYRITQLEKNRNGGAKSAI